MSGHWQPIQEGKTDTIGFKVKGDYEWIKPILQTKTKEVSVHAVWDVYSTVVDKDNNSLDPSLKNKQTPVVKNYYYEFPHTEIKDKIIADFDKDSLMFHVITVRSIT